jgi:hypothetical protein
VSFGFISLILLTSRALVASIVDKLATSRCALRASRVDPLGALRHESDVLDGELGWRGYHRERSGWRAVDMVAVLTPGGVYSVSERAPVLVGSLIVFV